MYFQNNLNPLGGMYSGNGVSQMGMQQQSLPLHQQAIYKNGSIGMPIMNQIPMQQQQQQQLPTYPIQQAQYQVNPNNTNQLLFPLVSMAMMQPYMDRQFLCKTFNFKVPYIQAFLSLTHEQKLKFFLIIQSRRLTGQLSSKQEYNELLHKISSIVNPNYNNVNFNKQYKQVSEEEIKKKLLQKEFEQKCQWEMKKLVQQQNNRNNYGGSKNDYDNLMMAMNVNNVNNKSSDNLSDWGSLGNVSNNSNNNNNNNLYKKDNILQKDDQQQQQFTYYQQPTSYLTNKTTTQSSPLINQPFLTTNNNNKNQQQQQWQQAQQQQLPNIQSKMTRKTSNSGSPKLVYSQRKLDSIWDLQINQQQLRKTQPNIKEIFGINKNGDNNNQNEHEQQQFGGFEEANNLDQDLNNDINTGNNNNDDFINVNIQSLQQQQQQLKTIIDFTKRQSPQKPLYNSIKTTDYYNNYNDNNQKSSINYIDKNNIDNQNNTLNWLSTTQSSQQYHPQLPQSLTYQPQISQQLFQLGSIQSFGQVGSGVISSVNIDMDLINNNTLGSNQNVWEFKEIIGDSNSGIDNNIKSRKQIKQQQFQQNVINTNMDYYYLSQLDTGLVFDRVQNVNNNGVQSVNNNGVQNVNNNGVQNDVNNENDSQFIQTNNLVLNVQNEDNREQKQMNRIQCKRQQQQQQQQQQWQVAEQVNPSITQQNTFSNGNNNILLTSYQPQQQTVKIQQKTQQQQQFNAFTFDDMFLNSNTGNNYNSNLNIVHNNERSVGINRGGQSISAGINQQQQKQQINYQPSPLFYQTINNNNQSQVIPISPQARSQKSIKIIRKISRPPSSTQIQLQQQSSNNNHNIQPLIIQTKNRNVLRRTSQGFNNNKKQSFQQYDDYLSKSQTIEPSLSVNNNPFIQVQIQQKPFTIIKKQPKLQQVSAINIAVNSSQMLPHPINNNTAINSPQYKQQQKQQYQSKSMATSFVYQHQYNNNNNDIQHNNHHQTHQKQQKIISTYNKPMSYTPNSLTTNMKSLLTKSKLFFKSSSKTLSSSASAAGNEQQKQQQNNNENLSQSMKQTSQNNYNKSNLHHQINNNSNKRNLNYSIQVGIGHNNNINDDKDFEYVQQQQQNNTQNRQQQQIRSPNNFKKKSSLQVNNKPVGSNITVRMEQYKQSQYQQTNSLQINNDELSQVLQKISQQLIYKLPQSQLKYIKQQLIKNKFFFDKVFYIELRELLQKLSLKNQLKDYLKSLQVKININNSKQSIQKSQYKNNNTQISSKLFSTQIEFLTLIIQKLNKIDQLNKQFTLAMQEDQQQQLAQVVYKSKQLTFQVNQDGQVAKRIAGMLIQGRLVDKSQNKIVLNIDDINQQIEKYKGVYYMLAKLLIVMPKINNNNNQITSVLSPISQQHITHLLNTFTTTTPTSSPLLKNKSQFLTEFTTLYLLHNHLNQLQYIKNISHTIFNYLIKQHTLLIQKINEIKRLSLKYGQSPQTIFSKLIETKQMVQYLKGLGQMAGVGERVLQVVLRIGVKFDNLSKQQQQMFEQNKLRKIITQCRQLAIKYNLLQSTNTKSIHHNDQLLTYGIYLSQIIKSITLQKSPQQIHEGINSLLKQHPVCKVCLMPKSMQQNNNKQGEFISKAIIVSQQSMGSHSHVQWCHFTCYNMLKMAFQDLADSSMVE